MGSGKNGKIEKVDKKKIKVSTQSPPPTTKPKEEKPKETKVSLLDTFLSVASEFMKDNDVQSREPKETTKENEEIRRRSEKLIRERE